MPSLHALCLRIARSDLLLVHKKRDLKGRQNRCTIGAMSVCTRVPNLSAKKSSIRSATKEAHMTRNILSMVVAVGALVTWFVAPASAQSIDQNFYYKMSTQFRGPGMKLDVFNGGARNNMTHLEPDQDVSGQLWRFRGNPDGTFRLSTSFRGPSMCLDIFNGGPNNDQPHLVHCANLTGQLWLPSLPDTAGAVRLTTRFRGSDMCLDIFNGGPNNNQPILPDAPISRVSYGC
jgi:hypothetical protein